MAAFSESYPKNLREIHHQLSQAQIDAFDNLMSRVKDPESYKLSYDPVYRTLYVHDFAGMLVGIEEDGYTHS